MRKRNKKAFIFHEDQMSQLLSWASDYEHFSFFTGNAHNTRYGSFQNILFLGKLDFIESNSNSFQKLDEFITRQGDWLYGYFSYELKNEIEALESNNPSTIPIANLSFIVPETVIHIHEKEIIIESVHNPETVFRELNNHNFNSNPPTTVIDRLISLTPKWQYIEHVKKIKEEIVDGEFYEMNYCIEFTADATLFNPLSNYQQLNALSPMPFSAFMRIGNIFLLCASPRTIFKKNRRYIGFSTYKRHDSTKF